MQNPLDLIRFETDGEITPRPGALIVALGAFIDAGNVQKVLAEHLLAGGEARVVASFDVDQLIDYRGRRPVMVFDTNRWVGYDDPSILLYALTDRDGQAYYLLVGPEPDFQWERLVEAVRIVMSSLGINLAVHVHGIPMGVPHTRPVGMTAHATNPRLIGDASSPSDGFRSRVRSRACSSSGSGRPAWTRLALSSTCRTTSPLRSGPRGRSRP